MADQTTVSTTTPAAGTAPAGTTPAAPAAAKSFADLKVKAKEAATPAPKDPTTPVVVKPDPDLEAAERILAEDARVKADAKRVVADAKKVADERAAWEAEKEKEKDELATARAVKAAVAKKDAIGALKALGLTDKDIYEGDDSIMFKMAEARTAKPQLDEKERLQAVVEEKLAEKEAAKKKEDDEKTAAEKKKTDDEKAAAQARVDAAQQAYTDNVMEVFTANQAKYPTLLKLGKAGKMYYQDVTAHAWDKIVSSKGEITLTEEQALDEMEKHYSDLLKDEEKAPPDKKAEPHRHMSITPDHQAVTPTPKRAPPGDLRGKFDALKEKARQVQK